MPKKNQIKKMFEDMPIESAETDSQITESAPADSQSEAAPSEQSPEQEIVESPQEAEQPSEEVPASTSGEDGSPEDLLEDVRRSLIEEETDTSQKESKWWRRIGKKSKSPEPEQPPVEIDIPETVASTEIAPEPVKEDQAEEHDEQLDDLLHLLETESDEVPEPTPEIPVEVLPEPEPQVDFEDLKKEAFRPREGEEAQKDSDVRSVALEGGEEVFVEVQAPKVDSVEERLQGFENALKPYGRYLNFALAFAGVVVAVIASYIIYTAYQQSRPQPTKVASNLPYPVSVSLPGGWSFNLGRGSLQDGKWEPNGPEWLEGTEVCRWVALPWSRQLEAVVRTLNPKDPIELVMSNDDKLTYRVYSVRQLTPEQMQKLDSNSPCLLVILTQPDAQNRWVLTALP